MKSRQRGNFVIGLIVGIVLGLGVALGVAVYVTKVPIPFVTKTQRGGAEQDEAEARKNRDWDPNAPLYNKNPAVRNPQAGGSTGAANAPATTGPLNAPTPAEAPPAVVPSTAARPAEPATARRPSEPAASSDPIGDLARARGGLAGRETPAAAAPSASGDNEPFVYFVQAGAFRGSDEAEAQRAKLSLMGVEAKITEREQAGRTVFRVRAGPFSKKDEADRLKERLDGGGFDAALVRVQR